MTTMTTTDAGGAGTAGEAGWVTVVNDGPRYRSALRAGAHALTVDEPTSFGGDDAGPTPYDLLLGAVASCMAITLRMYATRKAWPLEAVVVSMRTARAHAVDCADCVAPARRDAALAPLRLERRLELRGPLTDEQRARLAEIADRCPVKQALGRGVEVVASG
jgi:putative redox protein